MQSIETFLTRSTILWACQREYRHDTKSSHRNFFTYRRYRYYGSMKSSVRHARSVKQRFLVQVSIGTHFGNIIQLKYEIFVDLIDTLIEPAVNECEFIQRQHREQVACDWNKSDGASKSERGGLFWLQLTCSDPSYAAVFFSSGLNYFASHSSRQRLQFVRCMTQCVDWQFLC